jgi:MoxR-like ATPase
MCQPDVPDQPVRQKFQLFRAELTNALVERGEEVDLLLTSLICQENPLLIGPPGTAKSFLVDALMEWMDGQKFQMLFTRYSLPEEVFGPVSLMGLKQDRFVRVIEGKLPCADIAFGDEIFNASSGILNTLLKILNERVYEQGDGSKTKIPLKLFVGASNQWPHEQEQGKELNALFDRFLLRKRVKPILSREGRQRLWWNPPRLPKPSTRIYPGEIHIAHQESLGIPWSEAAKVAFESILTQLGREGILPGDRRQMKAVRAVQAFAYLEGATEVVPEHLQILCHVLWEDPAEQPEKVASVIAKVAAPVGMKANSLVFEAEEIVSKLNPGNLAEAAVAARKLCEIEKQLQNLGDHPKAVKARDLVRGQIRKIKLASIEAV